jgi:hypothetical protein
MPAKVRSSAGCWTCRLRRKKCDERRPVCDACATLEITCHSGDEKPEWMDGGARQKDMADKVKAQVKKQASQRRDRKYMEMLESGTRNVLISRDDDGCDPNARAPTADSSSRAMSREPGNRGLLVAPAADACHQSYASHSDTEPGSHLSSKGSGPTPPSSDTSGDSPPKSELPWITRVPWAGRPCENHDDDGPSVDVHFIMIYLDYIFPYLFPFYRPPVLSGGRGWILDVIQSNKPVYYTVNSIASYFFGLLLANGKEVHKECTDKTVRKLQTQLEMGLHELQKDMRRLTDRQYPSDTREQLNVMQAIIQMAIFEVATCNGDSWKVHLDAAIALFFQIVPKPNQWAETLNGLYTARWPPPSMGINRPWSTNQAALRFFTASLINMDVMSSITLERPPRLRAYQDDIIPSCVSVECRQDAQTRGPIFMDEFVGLHNWIIQIIGDVATLDAWKKENIKAGTLETCELVSRGQLLADALRGSLQTLETQTEKISCSSALASIVEDPLTELRSTSNYNISELDPAVGMHNKIWFHGVLLYLYTVVFGWQPEQADIKRSVSALTELFGGLHKASYLRAMVFPFCVAGCLAPREDEDRYRCMVNRMGPLKVFGSVREAAEIMERVWEHRDCLDETWDVAKCLRILGHRTLLI